MKAEVGDELIVASPEVGSPGRTGIITALTTEDGSPPYVVRWLAGYESIVFPGPDVRVNRRRLGPQWDVPQR